MQPVIYMMLNKMGKRRKFAQIAHWQNDALQNYDIWPLDDKADSNIFNPALNAIGNIYLGRIIKLDHKTNLAFVSLGHFEGVLKLKPEQIFTNGQYIYVEIIADAFDDKLLKIRFAGDAPKGENNKPKLHKLGANLAQFYIEYASKHNCNILTDDFALLASLKHCIKSTSVDVTLLNVEMSLQNKPDLFETHGLSEAVEALMAPKIKLHNGANIVIQHTEAMTVVDVNSGQFHASTNQMVTKINQQAAKVILNQLKLRKIGGLVIVDFLKYSKKSDKQKFINFLAEYVKNYNIQLGSYTQFGLVEFKIERKSHNLFEKLRCL